MEELKRYRNSFILLTLICAAGLLCGLYLYQYTDFFESVNKDMAPLPGFVFDARQVLDLFFSEAKVTLVLFILGFTLLSPYASSVMLLYKGFMSGFCTVCYGLYYQSGSISKRCFLALSASLILILIIYIIVGAKAMAFSGSLKYASPDFRSILKRKQTGRYLTAYLMLTVFLLLAVTLRYSAALL